MLDINKNISQFIEDQFPDLYKGGTDVNDTQRSVIIDFMEAYYEFIESNYQENFLASRNMFEYRDIDQTLDEFLVYFKTKYLNEFPVLGATDDRLAVKNIIDLYRAKGSEKAVKLLIRLMFNTDAEVYYPAQDVLRASTSTWILPTYLEVTRTPRNLEFVGTIITGSNTGTTAFVESVMTKRVNGKVFDVLYLSNITGGNFSTLEQLTNNGDYTNSPKVIGSLSDIEVTSGESGYAVGDLLDVVSPDGQLGTARITSVFDVTNKVDFDLLEGGYGYSLEDSEVIVSSAVLFISNPTLNYTTFDIWRQPLTSFNLDNNLFSIGDSIDVIDNTANTVATGVVVHGTANTLILETRTGSLIGQQDLYFDDPVNFITTPTPEQLEGESEVTLNLAGLSGVFTVGEKLIQYSVDGSGVYSNVAQGRIATANTISDVYELDQCWGTFIVGQTVEGQTSNVTATVGTVTVDYQGSTVNIVGVGSAGNTTIITVETTMPFSANTGMRGVTSLTISNIDSEIFNGATTLSSNTASANVVSLSDVSTEGAVIGQNENVVAFYGNTTPFIFTPETQNFIYNGNTSVEFTRIGTGSGATYDVGSLRAGTTEEITIPTDIIGGENVLGIPYLDILIDGSTGGNGRVANTSVINGGAGYSNGSIVTVTGGGWSGTDPIIPAEFSVTTDGSGVIVSLDLIDGGWGYFEEPVIAIADGAGAIVSTTIESGYGFPALPLGGLNSDPIADMLQTTTKTIGEIATIVNINPGVGYDTNVFTKIIDRDILTYGIPDNVLGITNKNGVFNTGEVILATTSGAVGRIEVVNATTLKIKRMSFSNEFTIGDIITGQTSMASASISSVTGILDEDEMAINAVVSSVVVLNTGVIATVEIVNSGFGYINNASVSLIDAANSLAGTGITSITRQGTGAGFWKTDESILNKQKLHDNDFYQEFSYEVIATVSLDKYEDVLRDILHVSGMKLFGRVVNTTYEEIDYTVISDLTQGLTGNTVDTTTIKADTINNTADGGSI